MFGPVLNMLPSLKSQVPDYVSGRNHRKFREGVGRIPKRIWLDFGRPVHAKRSLR